MNAHPRIATFTCPCCKGFIGEAAPLDQVADLITADQQRYVFNALSKEPGASVNRDELYKAMYGHIRTMPSYPGKGFSNLISLLRSKLEAHGWTIECRRGAKAFYRLLPLEAGQ